ncbi:hypothetical protein BDV93DRAFT_575485 [Ceratobasidium sp. AG-I]|nr:hypothetical protein BDV93DRAFT_575485 [Ceratobasidium sp. AG-I]
MASVALGSHNNDDGDCNLGLGRDIAGWAVIEKILSHDALTEWGCISTAWRARQISQASEDFNPHLILQLVHGHLGSEKEKNVPSTSLPRHMRAAVERSCGESQLDCKGKRRYMDHEWEHSPELNRLAVPTPPTSPCLPLPLVSNGYVMQLQPSPMLTDVEVTTPYDCTRTPATSRNGPGLWLSRTEREGRLISYAKNLDRSPGGVGEPP